METISVTKFPVCNCIGTEPEGNGARDVPRQNINPLTPELNPSKQGCLPEFFTGDFKF